MLRHWSKLPFIKTMLRDELRVFIQPHQITMLRIKKGMRKEIIAKEVIPVKALSPIETDNDLPVINLRENWRPAIASLAAVLSDQQWHGATPHIVISNHFVHYTVIPWNADLSNDSERQAYIRHCFFIAYGELSKQWNLCTSPSGYGQASLASGIEATLINAIALEFKKIKMKTEKIHPQLVIAVNESLHSLGKSNLPPSFWFVVIEQGRLCLAMVENGQWRTLKSFATEKNLTNQLDALIQRESIITGINTDHWSILVYWPESDSALSIKGREVSKIHHSITDVSRANNSYLRVMWA